MEEIERDRGSKRAVSTLDSGQRRGFLCERETLVLES